MKVDRAELLKQVLAHLRREFETLTRAANEARDGATHAESKQENKYDTRGLEASYLAAGQSQRASEVQSTIEKLKDLPLVIEADSIRPGNIIVLEKGDVRSMFFLLPYVGGLNLKSSDGEEVKVISSSSPLGKEILGKGEGEDFSFNGQTYSVVEFF